MSTQNEQTLRLEKNLGLCRRACGPCDLGLLDVRCVVIMNFPFFFAYNLPSSTGCEITPKMMSLFQERVPEMEGLKHSAFNFTYVREFVNMGLSCFIGFSSLTLPALSAGAVGTVDGAPGIAPEFWVELWNAFQDGDMERARAAQDKGIEVCNLIRIGGFHGVLKSAVSHRLGVDCGSPRPPGMPLSVEQDIILKRRLSELDLLPGE